MSFSISNGDTRPPFHFAEWSMLTAAVRGILSSSRPTYFSEKQIVRARVAAGTARRRALWQDWPAHADATIGDVAAGDNRQAALVEGGQTGRRAGWTAACRWRPRPGRVPSRGDGRAARLWWGPRWPLCWGQPIFFAAGSMALLVFVWSGPGCSGGRWPGCGAVPRSFCWGWPRSGA